MENMRAALDEAGIEGEDRRVLERYFAETATFLINRGSATARRPTDPAPRPT
jgi:hypothetical protein